MVSPSIIIAPHILLPRPGIDLTKFAVIACDQFTSQLEYWKQLEATIKDAPSSLRLIFPEAYLPVVDHDEYIHAINQNIDHYLADGLLKDMGEGFILVERSTPFKPRRLGLMLALDLEQYSYLPGNKSPIRASEATIVERIPPRLRIREHAGIELPHVLVLFDDPKRNIIERLYEQRAEFSLVYDFELNQGGGHLRGYFIKETAAIIASFYELMGDKSLLFIMGDGNHSLATAKAHWDKIKLSLSEAERKNHPARYSLVEAINIYDEGLDFEPIHRLVMHVGPDFVTGLQALAHGPKDGYGYHSTLM